MNGKPQPELFDPETDPTIRKWAARLGLPADSSLVTCTAEIERIREDIASQLKDFELALKSVETLWSTHLIQSAKTLEQAMMLIQGLQQNQSLSEQACSGLQKSLMLFDRKLNALETAIKTRSSAFSGSSDSMSLMSKELREVKGLMRSLAQSVEAMQPQIVNVKSPIAATKDKTTEGKDTQFWFRVTCGLLFVFVLQSGVGLILLEKLRGVNDRVINSEIRLKRIEENLGTVPQQKN
jgi:G:T/U-mismatch repair DNA glycosylase